MNAHSSEHFYEKSCDNAATKTGEFLDNCCQNKEQREASKNLTLNIVLDYQCNDGLHAQKKTQAYQPDQVNFAIPSIRRNYQQNQDTFYQLQSPYQQSPSDQLANYLPQLNAQQWTQSNHPVSTSYHNQPPMSCLDSRFSAVKPNKFPDTPPDSGSEPYSPPNNANAISNSNGINFVDLSCQNKNSSFSSSTNNLPPVQAFSNIRNIHPNIGSSYPHYLRTPQYMPHTPPRHLSCSFPKPSLAMYGPVEFSKVGHTMDYFGRDDLAHVYGSIHNPTHLSTKKRKYQDSSQSSIASLPHGIPLPIKHEPCHSDFNYGLQVDGGSEDEFNCDYSCDGAMIQDGSYRVITWSPHQQNKWASLVDDSGREVVILNYRVDADKGFNFALPDESFVCQKKNHFQITVHVNVSLKPRFARSVESNDVLESVDAFYLHFYGIKAESSNQTIKIEQSQSDRSKKVFNPIQIDLVAEEMNKVTVGRLHFSETTLNNMRKKGKPNPDQRYFQLVVSLEAHCANNIFTIASHVSDKIIVRASNPGQFENDVDVVWNKGKGSDVIYHAGRVGINTDNPDEALTVHGNVRVTGHVMAPSDVRAKINIEELDTGEQLRNISHMNVYKYHFSEEFADYAGLSDEEKIGAGVLAQEVYKILPDAVRETGDIVLSNGEIIEKLLVVNKERIFMENVGAVKELCKVTDKLEDRINEMESMKKKLANYCRNKLGSTWSSSSQSSVSIISGSLNPDKRSTGSSVPSKIYHPKRGIEQNFKRENEISPQIDSVTSSPSLSLPRNLWSTQLMQIVIVSLIIVMAACLISITTLYIIDRRSSNQHTQQLVMSLQKISNRSNSQQLPPSMSSKPKNFVPPICLKNQDECPVVCCEMPPNNPSFDNFPVSTNNKHPWWVDYMPSTKSWKKPHKKISNHALLYVQPKKLLSNRTKSKSVEPDYLKFAHKQHEKKHTRLKRDAGETMLQINVPQMNSTLSQDFCISKDCKEMNGFNFSYSIPLSSRYPLAFLTLQFMPLASGEELNVEFCSETKQRSCEEHNDESIYSTKGVGIFSWDLPVGYFFNSQYTFRVSHRDMENPCIVSGSYHDQRIMTYTFNFYRMCDK